jgi:hypothetical protein
MTWMLSLLLAVGLSAAAFVFLTRRHPKGSPIASLLGLPTYSTVRARSSSGAESFVGLVVRSIQLVIMCVRVVVARACARAVVLVRLLVLVLARAPPAVASRTPRRTALPAPPAVLSARRASTVARHAARAVVARDAIVVLLEVLLGPVAAPVVLRISGHVTRLAVVDVCVAADVVVLREVGGYVTRLAVVDVCVAADVIVLREVLAAPVVHVDVRFAAALVAALVSSSFSFLLWSSSACHHIGGPVVWVM